MNYQIVYRFLFLGVDAVANVTQEYETSYLGPDSKIYIGNFGDDSKRMCRVDNTQAI